MNLPNITGIRAIAIDLDGTLLDTIGDLSGAANRTLRAMGLPEIPLERLKTFVGKGKAMHVRRSLAASLGRDASDAEMAQALVIYEREYFAHIDDTTRPYVGAVEGVAALRAKGYPLACVTNKARAFTLKLLERQALLSVFDCVVAGDDLPRSKPDPAMITYTAGWLRVRPPEMLVIGDSGNDAEAARAAGAPVLLMRYGYTEGVPLESIASDGIFNSIVDIAAFLPRLK